MPAPKPKGFSKLKKNHAGHIDACDIMSNNTDPILASCVHYALKLGCFFSLGTNRAKSAVKIYLKYGAEVYDDWANTPEECVEKLTEVLAVLVEYCQDLGLVEKPAKL
jgi:hypothetical protein